LECDTSGIREADELSLRIDDFRVSVLNATSGMEMQAKPLSPFLLQIVDAGGLVPYLKARGRFLETRP
jgi:3-isopropylmalate/(R)-2-methylmalate dehydratase small subunit